MNTIDVIGLDPSMSNWGFAKATLDIDTFALSNVELHVAQTKPSNDKKLRKNSDDLARARLLNKEIANRTSGVAISFVEVPHGSQSARSMASYGVCIGLLASIKSFSMIQMSEQQVKLGTLGKKSATKEESIEWAYAKHPEANWPMRGSKLIKSSAEHMADALCTIYSGIQSEDFQNAIAVLKFAKVA